MAAINLTGFFRLTQRAITEMLKRGSGHVVNITTAGEWPGRHRGTARRVVRADGLAEIPIRREGVHNRFGVTSVQRGLVAADDITGVGVPGLEHGQPDLAPSVDRPLTAVGAEHHRLIVGRFGDDRHRPSQLRPSSAKCASNSTTARPPAHVEATVSIRAWRSASQD